MHRERIFEVALTCGALMMGWIAWSGDVLTIPLSVGFPIIWSTARTRTAAAMVSAAYFLAASRGLPLGVSTFYGSELWPGILLWFLASAMFVTVHSLLWTRRSGCIRAFHFLLAGVLMAVPPFGIFGWAHPLTAAGVLFPGWGWIGLATMTAALMLLTSRFRWQVAVILTGFWLWSAAHWTSARSPEDWYGVDLALGKSLGRNVALSHHVDLATKALEISSRGKKIVVFPENALGLWTSMSAHIWRRRLADSSVTVIAGATLLHKVSYENVVLRLSEAGSHILYRSRMPVPVSMWQPWTRWIGERRGAMATFFGDPIVTVGALRPAPLICYEQLLVWPMLQSMLHNPDAIIAIGNSWWATGTSIGDIQRSNVTAWASLFDKPVVFAFNT